LKKIKTHRMRFILKTTHLFFLCLFFAANMYGQKTTKKVTQTFSPDETIQSIKIESKQNSTYVLDRWDTDFVWIECTIDADVPNIGDINSYKAEYKKLNNIATLKLDERNGAIFIQGNIVEVKLTYQIYIPANLELIED